MTLETSAVDLRLAPRAEAERAVRPSPLACPPPAVRVQTRRHRCSRTRAGKSADPLVAELVVTAVRNSITDERGRRPLGSHFEARSEYRIRTRHRGYVIDRVVRGSDGTLGGGLQDKPS